MVTIDEVLMKLYNLVRDPATSEANRNGTLLSYLMPTAKEFLPGQRTVPAISPPANVSQRNPVRQDNVRIGSDL